VDQYIITICIIRSVEILLLLYCWQLFSANEKNKHKINIKKWRNKSIGWSWRFL